MDSLPEQPNFNPPSGEDLDTRLKYLESQGRSPGVGASISGGRSGGAWEPPTPEQLQGQIPQYKVLSLLGRGGMGAVYQGWQISLERYVAIKILPPDADDGDAQFAARFKQEAKTMAKFLHPGIVAVFDAGETATGLLYIVMEFVEGTDLAQMVQSNGRLQPDHALSIMAHVCDALQYAHARGVVHRDIKPANVMLNTDGQVKVADFGLAKAASSSQHGLTRTNMSMGTPDYVAPEALMLGVVTDHRADLYAMGVMLYNMLTGEIPRGMFRLPSQKVGTDPRFDEVIRKAMEQEREHRYQSAVEIRRDLDVIASTPMPKAEEAPPRDPPPPPSPPPGAPARRPVMKGPRQAPGSAGFMPAASQTRPQPSARVPTTGKAARDPGKKSSVGVIWGILGVAALSSLIVFWASLKRTPSSSEASSGSAAQSATLSQISHWTPREWVDLMPDARLLIKKGDAIEKAGGVGFTRDYVGPRSKDRARNGIVRAVAAGAVPKGLLLAGQKGTDYRIIGMGKDLCIDVRNVSDKASSWTRLCSFPYPDGFDVKRDNEYFFEIVGDKLHAWINNTLVAEARNEMVRERSFGVDLTPDIVLKKCEYGVLPDDARSPVSGATASIAKRTNKGESPSVSPPSKPATPPPKLAAHTLFDGRDISQWLLKGGRPADWRIVDGALVAATQDLDTREKFQDFVLHAEFAVPHDAHDGNSGIYLQGRYELQILESFGKPATNTSNGAIFKIKAPAVNASTAPDTWQSYDITFRAARFGASGQKTENARVTVIQNGKIIQSDIEIPGRTENGDPETAAPGPIRLQGYGSPVRFRNITISPAPSKDWISVLPLINPQKDRVDGEWKLVNGELQGNGNFARLALPYSVPQEYDFRIRFTRQSGNLAVSQHLVFAKHDVMWLMGGFSNSAWGLEQVNGAKGNSNSTTIKSGLENGRRYETVVKVRRDRIQVEVDGKLVEDYKTDGSDFSMNSKWTFPDSIKLGLGCQQPTVFHSVEIREVK